MGMLGLAPLALAAFALSMQTRAQSGKLHSDSGFGCQPPSRYNGTPMCSEGPLLVVTGWASGSWFIRCVNVSCNSLAGHPVRHLHPNLLSKLSHSSAPINVRGKSNAAPISAVVSFPQPTPSPLQIRIGSRTETTSNPELIAKNLTYSDTIIGWSLNSKCWYSSIMPCARRVAHSIKTHKFSQSALPLPTLSKQSRVPLSLWTS